jgi:hypothetical protein
MSKPPSKQLGKFQKVGECLYRYSSNGVYYVVARHAGKLIRRSLETTDKELAKRKAADFKIDLQRVDSSLGKMTVGELLKRLEPPSRRWTQTRLRSLALSRGTSVTGGRPG